MRDKDNKQSVDVRGTFRSFFKLIQFGMPRWILCLIGVIIIGIGSYIFSLAIGLLLSTSLEHFENNTSPTYTLLIIFLVLIGATIITICGYIANLHGAFAIRTKIQKQLIARWIRLSERFATKKHSSTMMAISTSDMEIVEDFYFQGLLSTLFVPLVQGIAALITTITIDWRLLMPSVITGIIALVISISFSSKVQWRNRQLRLSTDRITKNFSEIIGSNVTQRMSGSIERTIESYHADNIDYADEAAKTKNIQSLLNFSSKTLDAICAVCFLGISMWLSSSGILDFSVALLVYPLQSLVGEMFTCFGKTWNFIISATAAGERVIDSLSWPIEEERLNGKALQGEMECLEFSNVSFGYEKENPVIHNMSFCMSKGQTVALVGPSGGGKSTIFQLLLDFYKPDNGCISINGVSCEDYTLNAWRKKFVYLQQDVPLLALSIRDNIGIGKFGAAKASDEEIERAAKAAGAHEFITALPEGYQTPIDENGGNLSGGQQQRIAIARAFMSNAPILLLDEPTAALDAESERLVQESLDTLMKEKTVLVAAHRLNTIREADKILVLQSGTIAEQGTHEELMNAKGIYADLYTTQFGKNESVQ